MEPSKIASGLPLKIIMASVVVLSMLVLSAVIISLGWSGARQAMLETASKSASDAGRLISEKASRMIQPAQATLRQLATDPLADATSLDDRLSRLRTLFDLLAWNNLASSIFVGYTDGSFMLVRALDQPELRQRFNAPPKSNFLVQSIESRASGKSVGEYLFFDTELHLIERRAQPDYQFDPRTRIWFQNSRKTAASLASDPYLFYTTQQLGLTLSQSSENGKAVFGIDIVLDELTSNLNDLRITPNSHMALLDNRQMVLAYPDMPRVLSQRDGVFNFRTLNELGVPSLSALNALGSAQGATVVYRVGDQDWVGGWAPFNAWSVGGMRLLVAAPVDDLLGELKSKRMRLILLIAGLAALLLPIGWWGGAAVGSSLNRLTQQALRFSCFDFRNTEMHPSLIREVNHLSSLMNTSGQTIETFLQIGQAIANEPKVELMLENVLKHMVTVTRCTAGAVFLWDDHQRRKMRRTALIGPLQGYPQADFEYTASEKSASAQREVIHGLAEIKIELRGRKGQLEGLLVLQHPQDSAYSGASFIEFIQKLSSVLAVTIETGQLIEAQKKLMDGVVRLLADAIDAKSPYTGGHCERVPELAGMLVDQMVCDTSGPYAEFQMSEDERYEFQLGAWLHDCGKVTSPEHIIDKATKLETIYNRIHEIRMRFEVLWRDAELAYWKARASGGDDTALSEELRVRQQALQADYAFLARCNVPGESMADDDIKRLHDIASTVWMRHFDNRIGLSQEESRQMGPPLSDVLPVQERLLADRPEHRVPWGERKPAVEKENPKNNNAFDMILPQHAQNMGEVYNLSVRRGTLTDEDRFKINDHIVQTLLMLRGLPWPAHLAKVPDIAATHHEKLNGKGYPRRLSAEKLTLADRVMALADIFEALTAADRPYKSPKTLTDSLRIMAFFAKDQHIDPQLFRYFLHSRLWLVFAEKFMLPEQIDNVNVDDIERLISAPA